MDYFDNISKREALEKLIGRLIFSYFISPLFLMLVWNWVAVDMFNVPHMAFWQAFIFAMTIRIIK